MAADSGAPGTTPDFVVTPAGAGGPRSSQPHRVPAALALVSRLTVRAGHMRLAVSPRPHTSASGIPEPLAGPSSLTSAGTGSTVPIFTSPIPAELRIIAAGLTV